jgi:hypothetical protein
MEKWCIVCGDDLDAQGRCPKGHVQSFHTKKETTLGLGKTGKAIVKLIEATEYLAQAMVFASYQNTGGAAMFVGKAKEILGTMGLSEEDLAPVMVPLENITKSMYWAKMRDSIGYVLNQMEHYAPRWVKG